MTPPGRTPGRLHVVLLAGGSGTRFWPMSRKGRPKQFLTLVGPESLLRATWARARRLAPADRIWVDPDCGLKTRTVEESRAKLEVMMSSVRAARTELG